MLVLIDFQWENYLLMKEKKLFNPEHTISSLQRMNE